MTTHPTADSLPKNRHALSVVTTTHGTLATGYGHWLGQKPQRPVVRGMLRDEVDALVLARTAELEREIAALRQEVDRRAGVEKELSAATTAAEDAQAAQTAWVAFVAAQLRAPLHDLLERADRLGRTALAAPQAVGLHELRERGEGLLKLVADLQVYDALRCEPAPDAVDFDVAEELQPPIDMYSDAAARKGLELGVEFDAGLPARVRGNPVHLRQIISALLDNAVKFTARGKIALQVRLERTADDRLRLRCDVTDTGVGIPAALQPALFEPWGAAAIAARRARGAGLGLAICRRLAEAMDGELGVISAEAAGSTFWVTVTVEHARGPVPSVESSGMTLAGRHVLIIDDNGANRTLFCHLASAWAMRAGGVESAEAARAYLRSAAEAGTPVDIAVLDQHLTGADALAVAKALAQGTEGPRPVVAMLTSRADPLSYADLKAHGVVACEKKPIHPKKLRAMLVRSLAKAGLAPIDRGGRCES